MSSVQASDLLGLKRVGKGNDEFVLVPADLFKRLKLDYLTYKGSFERQEEQAARRRRDSALTSKQKFQERMKRGKR